MFRITTAPDGHKTARCVYCGDSRSLRSERLLAQWKTAHANTHSRRTDLSATTKETA